jgi:hypothetical protein
MNQGDTMTNLQSIFTASTKTARTSTTSITKTFGEGKGAPKVSIKLGGTPAMMSEDAIVETAAAFGMIVTFSGNLSETLKTSCKQAQDGVNCERLLRALFSGVSVEDVDAMLSEDAPA